MPNWYPCAAICSTVTIRHRKLVSFPLPFSLSLPSFPPSRVAVTSMDGRFLPSFPYFAVA